MRIVRTFLTIALIVLGLQSAFAGELTETWTSARALGMGNAYTAVVTGTDSLFYNPAGLARSMMFNWTVFDPRAGINGLDTVNTVKDLRGDTDDIPALVDPLYGKRIWTEAGIKSAIQVGTIAGAIFGSADASGLLSNRAYPTFDLNYYVDYGLAVGAGFSAGGIANFGITARRITRTGTSAPLTAGDFAKAVSDSDSLTSQLKHVGTGYGLDLGLVLTPPTPASPALSLVWKNVGTTQFSAASGETPPQRIDSEIIMGTSLSLEVPLLTITPAFDYKFLNRPDVQTGKKIHLGVEFALPLLDLRAGLNEGYYTLGAGFNTGILRIDAVTYGVELGEYPGQLEDRRYMVQVSVDLGFDFGNLSGNSGNGSGPNGGTSWRPRLKQRR